MDTYTDFTEMSHEALSDGSPRWMVYRDTLVDMTNWQYEGIPSECGAGMSLTEYMAAGGRFRSGRTGRTRLATAA